MRDVRAFPSGGSQPISISLFGPRTMPVGLQSPRGADLLTAGVPATTELAEMTSI